MKRHFTLFVRLLRNYKSPVVALLCLLGIYSCQRYNELKVTGADNIAMAREYFSGRLRSEAVEPLGMSFLPDSLVELRNADWDAAFEQSSGDTVRVFVPVRLPYRLTLASGGLAGSSLDGMLYLRLMDKGSGFTAEMISLVPDRVWRTGNPFSGRVVVEDWFRPSRWYYATEEAGAKPVKLASRAPTTAHVDPPLPELHCVDFIYEICVGEGEDEVCTTVVDETCTWVFPGPGDGGDPGGGGGDPGDLPGLPPGGGGSPPGQDDTEDDPLIGNFCSGMTLAQKNIIKQMLVDLKSYSCASRYIYNLFDAQGKSFDFCINGGTGNASYNPVTKGFNFTTDYAASREDLMEHEFFHAFQDVVYPGGTAQYGRVNGQPQPGYVNIEFEQAVINDIVHGNNTAFGGSNVSSELKSQYQVWIEQITNNKSEYPKLIANGTPEQVTFYNNFISKYNNFLTQFNNLPGNPYTSTALSLNPIALINLFNSINPDCQ